MLWTTKNECSDASAQKIADDLQIGWNLGNTLDSLPLTGYDTDSETAWGNPKATLSLFHAVRAAGFGAVRIPVTWAGHFGDAPDYRIDPAWLARVEQVVNYALDNHMYAILNLHHDGSQLENSPAWLTAEPDKLSENQTCLCALWKQIAEHFAGYGTCLLFEGMNEPRVGDDWLGKPAYFDVVNQLNAAFVRTVRATGGNNEQRLLLLPTYAAAVTEQALNAMKLPDDTRLMVSVHAYFPFEFCFPAEDICSCPPSDTWGSTKDRCALFRMLDRLEAHFTKKGVPVVIGEMGAVKKPDDTNRIAWAQAYIYEAATRGIRCFWWDTVSYGENMGLLNRTSETWYYPDLTSAIVRASRL